MRYQVRKNAEGEKEVIFDLKEVGILTSATFYQILCDVAIREFPGIPPVMDFFNFNFEGEKDDTAMVSLKWNFLLNSNMALANC